MNEAVRWHGRLALVLLALAALSPQFSQAQSLPKDDLERDCWLKYTRERTNVRLVEPTAVAFSNLRNGDTVSSPFRIDFSIRGMGVIPAGKPHPKAPHHHVLLNTPLPFNPADKIPFNDYHRHFGKGQTGAVLALPAGQHTLRLLFADHDHRPYFVFSPELRIQVAGPRTGTPLRIDPANFAATCKAWYQDELSRPRPEGQRAVVTNLRDYEPVVSPFNLRLAVDGYGVAPKGRGGEGLGHFLLDVLGEGGRVVQAIDLGHGATQVSLFLPPAAYTLRLRFVDDSGRRGLVPADLTPIVVTAQERI